MPHDADAAIAAHVERALARLAERAPAALADPGRRAALAALALCSDFAIDTLVRQPELLDTVDAARCERPVLAADAEADWPARLRRWPRRVNHASASSARAPSLVPGSG